jgi:hypothetical protein
MKLLRKLPLRMLHVSNTLYIPFQLGTDMELMVRPSFHSSKEWNSKDVLEVVLKSCESSQKKYGLKMGVVLYVITDIDGIQISYFYFFRVKSFAVEDTVWPIARLAVEYRNKGVCGFGIFGTGKSNE